MHTFSHLVAGIAVAVASMGTALAHSCPAEMKKIDAALSKSPNLSSTQMTEVKKLRADGDAMHKAGKHGESMKALAQAKTMLGVK